MPTMPRYQKKAQKIAYSILGTPANIAHKKTKKEKYVDHRLEWEETFRAR